MKQTKKYVIGNWKSNKGFAEAKLWFDDFARVYRPQEGLEVIIAPTFLCLEQLFSYLRSLKLGNISLAAQDVSSFPRGSYTGAIAADLLRGMAEYVIVGHSERRRYFRETSQDVGNKVLETVDAGLVPIVCVDQPYGMSQLTTLNDIEAERVIMAYCPVDSVNFRAPQSQEKVAEATRFISQVHPRWPIVYGGCLRPENIEIYAKMNEIAGVFVGSASLDPKSFTAIVEAVASSLNG